MKPVIILFFLLTAWQVYGQDTTKVEQYCEVTIETRSSFSSNKVVIKVDYGQQRNVWKQNWLKDKGGKPQKFNSPVDAINFMGKEGWKLVNAFGLGGGADSTHCYIFKKEFNKADTEPLTSTKD